MPSCSERLREIDWLIGAVADCNCTKKRLSVTTAARYLREYALQDLRGVFGFSASLYEISELSDSEAATIVAAVAKETILSKKK